MKPIEKACDIVGGQSELARSLGVTISAVNQWVLGRREVPAARCPDIEALTNGQVRCEDLCESVNWAVLRKKTPAPSREAMNPNEIIDSLGGTGAVSRLCGITDGAVSQWRDNGIPRPWVKFFEQLRPDLFESKKNPRAVPRGLSSRGR